MVAAVGQTILTWDSRTSAKVEAHPWPVSPKPCKKIRVAVCLPLAETMTGGLILIEAAPELFSGLDFFCPEVGDVEVEFDEEVEDERWPIYETMRMPESIKMNRYLILISLNLFTTSSFFDRLLSLIHI